MIDTSFERNYLSYQNEIYDNIENETLKKIKELDSDGSVQFDKELDAIAYDIYEDEQLYWVIAVYNDIIDGLKPDNRYLSYPNKNEVINLLNHSEDW